MSEIAGSHSRVGVAADRVPEFSYECPGVGTLADQAAHSSVEYRRSFAGASDAGGLRSGAVDRRSAGSEAAPIDNLGAEPLAGDGRDTLVRRSSAPIFPSSDQLTISWLLFGSSLNVDRRAVCLTRSIATKRSKDADHSIEATHRGGELRRRWLRSLHTIDGYRHDPRLPDVRTPISCVRCPTRIVMTP